MQPITVLNQYAGLASLLAASCCVSYLWILHRRLARARKDLIEFAGDLFQMADLVGQLHRKVSDNLNDMDERVLEISAPGADPSLPLERRHRVLTLSGRGMASREIAGRLKMPVGEVELILGLRKFAEVRSGNTPDGNGSSGAPNAERWKRLPGEMLA
jgi:hypothetical protein